MQRVLLVIGAALAFGSLLCVRAGGGPEDIQSAAQDVADAACPIAMMHQYGCPIPTTTPPPGLQQDASQRCSAGPGDTGGGCHDEEDEEHERHRRFKEMHWPIGSVPVGVGFDTTTMSVRLPVFLPEGTWQHVFQMELLNQTFMTIDDYAGTLNPNNMQALVTGKVSSDLGSVYNTFFGSYSSMYRTTQVDVITRAQLSTTPTLLDRVQDAIAYLPEEYDAATYNLFIHYWGTHVVTAAAIGGACEQLVSVKSCFASGDASLLQNTAQLQLGVKTLQTQLPTGQSLNQEYMEHTTSESVHMYGGDVKYIEANQWPQRSKTIAQSPVLIKVEAMAPITQYVADAKRQANLQQAIVAYQAAALQQQQQQIAAAKAARVFTVQAATTVIFNGVQASFGYRQHYCHGWWIFKHCGCRGETACFNPGNCGTGCGGGVSATAIVGDMPTTTLHMGEQATLTPNGQQSCMCSAYPNYETPTWPFNDLTQSVTCSIDANGNVVASNVQIPNANIRRISGSVSQQDGSPVGTGCSIATATYSGLQWTETGGNAGCGASTGTLSMSGSITAQGWCCIGTTLTAVWNPGQEGCFGQLQSESCPGFND